ncbi:MAG: V-type ATP synthase subunit B [Candidatus Methanodesulfokora sp.]
MALYGKVYRGIEQVKGPLVIMRGVPDASYEEVVRFYSDDGREWLGQVIEVGKEKTILQVLGDTEGLETKVMVKFTGSTLKLPVSDEILGRVFNGSGMPIDGGPPVRADDYRDINGAPINPVKRDYPDEFVETGISVIDGMLSLVRGQKLPLFSEAGLPHNMVAAQIARQAVVPGKSERFAIVFAAVGLKYDDILFFRRQFEEFGALSRSVLFLNLANDPVIERITTPRVALTAAEYLAFDLDMDVLVIVTDMTNYCEALRELSSAREEVPSRKGYPGYMYSDLASIYERAGRIKGKAGSITFMPILTMPGGDLTHPIPDLTGYITEGQIFLDLDLFNRGIYPPINALPSLSRLMKDGIGAGKTREDHKEVSDQLYASYSQGVKARELVKIVGEAGLSERERLYLEFAKRFEERLLSQGFKERRTIEETLDIAWDVLSMLPEGELTRISDGTIRKFHPKLRGEKTVIYEGI